MWLAIGGLVACGGDEGNGPGVVEAVEESGDDGSVGEFDPYAGRDGNGAQGAENEAELELSELISTSEFVDLMVETHVDLDELCSNWAMAQRLGAEDVAYEGFEQEFESEEGFTPREVFDELVSRC